MFDWSFKHSFFCSILKIALFLFFNHFILCLTIGQSLFANHHQKLIVLFSIVLCLIRHFCKRGSIFCKYFGMAIQRTNATSAMNLIITDTNVFFDIIKIGALPEFFALDFEICTRCKMTLLSSP